MRLIDADGLIAKLEEEKKEFVNVGYVIGLDAAQECIKDTPTVEQQRWIPVSERLPESYKDVLVWYEYFNYNFNSMYHGYGIGFCSPDGTWHGDVSGLKARCLAWMPLPDAYEGEDKE